VSDNEHLHRLACPHVKYTGLDLADPVNSVDANFQVSEVTNVHTIQAMRVIRLLVLQYHIATTSNMDVELKKQGKVGHTDTIIHIIDHIPIELARSIRWEGEGARGRGGGVVIQSAFRHCRHIAEFRRIM
jgi:hypothetical protein